jgi:hypothetical protein
MAFTLHKKTVSHLRNASNFYNVTKKSIGKSVINLCEITRHRYRKVCGSAEQTHSANEGKLWFQSNSDL